jgi:hypothetical protein
VWSDGIEEPTKKSTAATVDEYIAQVPEERRAALRTLRSLCLYELAGYDEAMQ